MAAKRSPRELAPLAAFIGQLYELGEYATWKEFAVDAGIQPPQLSEFKNGQVEPAGLNLFRLIEAAARRSGEAPVAVSARTARTEVDSLRAAIVDALDSLKEGQDELMAAVASARQAAVSEIGSLRSHLDDLPSSGRSFPRGRQGNADRR